MRHDLAPFFARKPGGQRTTEMIAFDESRVTFRYKDYRRNEADSQQVMTLAADEFMRRLLLHVLSRGFHRIRHYGLLAGAAREASLALARQIRDVAASGPDDPADGRTSVCRAPAAASAGEPDFGESGRCQGTGATRPVSGSTSKSKSQPLSACMTVVAKSLAKPRRLLSWKGGTHSLRRRSNSSSDK